MYALAEAADREALAVHETFDRRLGSAILEKLGVVGKLADLVREWDKNNDGNVSKIEFRQCVRGSLGLKADNKEIDAFFASMDADGGEWRARIATPCAHELLDLTTT